MPSQSCSAETHSPGVIRPARIEIRPRAFRNITGVPVAEIENLYGVKVKDGVTQFASRLYDPAAFPETFQNAFGVVPIVDHRVHCRPNCDLAVL